VAAVKLAENHGIPGIANMLESIVLSRTGNAPQAWQRLDGILEIVPAELAGQAHHVLGFVLSQLKRYSDAITEYEKALATTGYDTPGIALNDLGLAYVNNMDYDRAIEFFEKALTAPGYDTPGHPLNNLGLVYARKKDYDRAIQFYEKAFASPEFDKPGNALYSLGLACSAKKDYDRAIEFYERALATPGCDKPGYTLNNLGLAYASKKDYDRAIEFYEKALATPEFDRPGNALYNLGLAYSAKKDYDRAIEFYEKAVATPGCDKPGYILNNLGLEYANKKDYVRAKELYRKALATPGYETPEISLYNLGTAYLHTTEYDHAIELYAKALATPGYDTPWDALTNLGTVYLHKKNYDRAIALYEEALATGGCEKTGHVFFNLGNAYYDKKDYNRAIEYFEKALLTPGYDNTWDALNNLGLAYADKKDYDRAIEFFERALANSGYDTPHLTRLNLTIVLLKTGRIQEALAQVDSVLSESNHEEQHDRARRLKRLIDADLAGISASTEDAALVPIPVGRDDSDSPEARMRTKLLQLEDKYQEYLAKSSSDREGSFSVLRGWSSAVTLLEGSKDLRWRGGGYFLKWNGKGIVVDPGFDFLDNFHDAGFHARELDAVLVSHNHSDHNMDLKSIDDLRYEVYWRSTEPTADGRRRPAIPKSQIVLDEDTARAFDDAAKSHRHSALRFTKADYDRKRWLLTEHTQLPLRIEHFPVQHGPDVPGAVGIRLSLHEEGRPDFIIGYTGDTRFFDGLVDRLNGCDLLLAHISQPDNEEFTDPDHEKEKHLGYNGVTKLIQQLDPKPKLILVGEFWAGLADLRIELIQGLRQRTGANNILPAGLGLHLRIPSLEVECTECGRPTNYDQLRIAPPTFPFGPLGFLCGRCMV